MALRLRSPVAARRRGRHRPARIRAFLEARARLRHRLARVGRSPSARRAPHPGGDPGRPFAGRGGRLGGGGRGADPGAWVGADRPSGCHDALGAATLIVERPNAAGRSASDRPLRDAAHATHGRTRPRLAGRGRQCPALRPGSRSGLLGRSRVPAARVRFRVPERRARAPAGNADPDPLGRVRPAAPGPSGPRARRRPPRCLVRDHPTQLASAARRAPRVHRIAHRSVSRPRTAKRRAIVPLARDTATA